MLLSEKLGSDSLPLRSTFTGIDDLFLTWMPKVCSTSSSRASYRSITPVYKAPPIGQTAGLQVPRYPAFYVFILSQLRGGISGQAWGEPQAVSNETYAN
jgi:hypothetical protein